jgi:hypothetical protein
VKWSVTIQEKEQLNLKRWRKAEFIEATPTKRTIHEKKI